MGKTVIGRSEACEHLRHNPRAIWLKNDGEGAPAIFVERIEGAVVILTNQTIYLKCSICYAKTLGQATELRNTLTPPT